ncbi:hypothetical protein C8F01DRAFT_1255064 [Mycena amicta]|nr:hypothetical protein C8F01DRAFT_1255064 [Mycena amicta]
MPSSTMAPTVSTQLSNLPSSTMTPTASTPSQSTRFIIYPVSGLHGYPHVLPPVEGAPDQKIRSHLAAFDELPLWDNSGLRCADCDYERVSLSSPTRPYAYTILLRCPHTRAEDYSNDLAPNASVGLLLPARSHNIKGNLVVVKHTPVLALSQLLNAGLLDAGMDDLPIVHDFVRQYVWGPDYNVPLPPNTFVL